MQKISVVLPVYNEAESVENTSMTLSETLQQAGLDYEILFVDDGSTDETWSSLIKITQENKAINAISLTRNFGKERALYAGLEHALGDAVITMDGDLQHPVELIPEMVRIWKTKKCDVVNGVKTERIKEDFKSSWLVNCFYKLFKLCTKVDIKGASDFKLLDRKVVNAYLQLSERNLFYRGLIPWLGFNQESILYSTKERNSGTTKWSLLGRFLLAINAIVSFSSLPLQLVTFMGFIFFVISIILMIQTLYIWFSGNALEGFTTLILVITFTGSVLMVSLGVIGQYLAKIYTEVKRRPLYMLRAKTDKNKSK